MFLGFDLNFERNLNAILNANLNVILNVNLNVIFPLTEKKIIFHYFSLFSAKIFSVNGEKNYFSVGGPLSELVPVFI